MLLSNVASQPIQTCPLTRFATRCDQLPISFLPSHGHDNLVMTGLVLNNVQPLDCLVFHEIHQLRFADDVHTRTLKFTCRGPVASPPMKRPCIVAPFQLSVLPLVNRQYTIGFSSLARYTPASDDCGAASPAPCAASFTAGFGAFAPACTPAPGMTVPALFTTL